MADQHNDNIPALGNLIASDIPDIKENLEWHKDCFQKVCNGFSNTSTSSFGFLSTVFIPASAMLPNTTSGAELGIYEYTTNDIIRAYYAFSGSASEYVGCNIVMPEGWNRSTVKAKFYWSSATGSTAGDTVEWSIGISVLSNNDDLDSTIGTTKYVSDTLLANNGTKLQISDATDAVSLSATATLNDLVHIKIGRNPASPTVADDMAEDAWLFGVLIQFSETMPDADGSNAIAAW